MQWYTFNSEPLSNEDMKKCREELVCVVRPVAEKYGLEMEPFSAMQEGSEWVQGVFLNTGTLINPWDIGSILRKHNGTLLLWGRGENFLPFEGLKVIEQSDIEKVIQDMIDKNASP